MLVPKVNLPGDHQVMNARAMRNAGAAEILFEDTVMENGGLLEYLDGKVLAEKILALVENPLPHAGDGRKEQGFSKA